MAEKVSWRAQMALGYAPLDEEHEAFIPVVNEALEVLEKKDFIGAENVFDKCYAFARTHFSHEEALMEKLDYPDIIAHMKSHQIFIQNISELRQLYEFAPEDEKAIKMRWGQAAASLPTDLSQKVLTALLAMVPSSIMA